VEPSRLLLLGSTPNLEALIDDGRGRFGAAPELRHARVHACDGKGADEHQDEHAQRS
jgi:hypothetical protein